MKAAAFCTAGTRDELRDVLDLVTVGDNGQASDSRGSIYHNHLSHSHPGGSLLIPEFSHVVAYERRKRVI